MGLFVKNVRAIVNSLTTTTTTTTSTTTTTTNPNIPISDGDVYIGGFASIDILTGGGAESQTYLYNTNTPIFDEFPKSTGGLIDDIQMDIPTNNTTILDNLDGTYDLNVDIVMTYQNNNATEYRAVDLPRLAIDLPYSSLKSTTSTFGHGSSVSQLRLYTGSRVVMEFNTLTIPPLSSRSFTIQGTTVLSTSTTQSKVRIVDIQPFAFNYKGLSEGNDGFEFQISATQGQGSVESQGLQLGLKSIYRDYVVDDSNVVVGQFTSNIIYEFLPPTIEAIGTNYAGSIIRVDDRNNPFSLVNNSNKKGYAEIDGTVGTTTTTTSTTSTTAPPDVANMSFKTSGFPQSTDETGVYQNGTGIQYVVQVDNTTYDPVKFRVFVSSPDFPTQIGIEEPVNSTEYDPLIDGFGNDSIFLDGELVDDDTLLSGVNKTVTATFLNSGTSTGTLILQLYVDTANNGTYVLQDTLSYEVSSDQESEV